MTDPRARIRKFWRRRPRVAASAAAACVLAAVAWWYTHGSAVVYHHVGGAALRVSAGVGGMVRGASDFLLTHPHFTVREVKVLGAERVEVEDIVVMSGLRPRTGIWSTDPEAMEESVERHPWVRRALVRREFPARLIITVEEWSPGAIVALDRLYYVADDGVIFKALDEEDPVDFPFVTGLRAAGLAPEAADTREKLSQVLELARAVERTTLELSEIRFRPGGDIVLYPVSYAVPFLMGWGDWDDKLGRLQWFLREFREQAARFRAVDLSFRGQVVTRPRKRA